MNNNPFFFTAGIILLLGVLPAGCQQPVRPAEARDAVRQYEIWEPEPAPNRGHEYGVKTRGRAYPYDKDWERRSYPIGNGTLGANVFGRTDVERIQLTEKPLQTGVRTAGAG